MNAYRSVQLMRKYANCKKCGNDKVGDGEGTLIIEDNIFKRSCKCGW
ncbi:MAG TPA: DUF3797 domain-containing protein, partial [Brevibacillus sp.]|nr:DUF3797 domain-containing protein [Brevibacillus sp.]